MPERTDVAAEPGISTGLFAVLGFIGILGPFGTDAFVPALPAIAAEFDASQGTIQLAFGVFGIGMALGQLVMGPLSDRFGRRLFLISGTFILALGSLIAMTAQEPMGLILGCFIMGLGGASSVVIVWAVVADLTHGSESARGLAIVDMMVSLGPILGPLGGAAIMTFAGWREIFLGVALYSLVAMILSVTLVRESYPKSHRSPLPIRQSFREYALVFRNRNFLLRFGSLLATFGILFAYIGASPFFVMDQLGLSVLGFSLIFALNGLGIILANFVTAWLSRRIATERIFNIGVVIQLVAASVFLGLILVGNLELWLILPVMFLLVASFGLIFGTGTALSIAEVRDKTGSALALLGASQFLAGGLTITAIGLGDSALMMGIVTTALAVFSIICSTLVTTHYRERVE